MSVPAKSLKIQSLRAVPLLEGLSDRDLERVLARSTEEEFRAGDVIVEAGNRACDFYILLRGEAELSVPDRKTATLGPGDYFGEMAVLDGEPRSATIVAETHVSSLRIARPDFLALLDAYGSIGRTILVEMSKRLRAAWAAGGRN
jgi:CRP-like cAMP-binding protein